MDKFFERLNLYDILAMFIPGSIVLMGLGMFDGICEWANDLSFMQYVGMEGHAFWTTTAIILFFVVAYMIGIIIQSLNVYLWSWAEHTNNWFVKRYIKKKIDTDPDRGELQELVKPAKNKDNILGVYYEAYNYAIVFHPHTAVLTIEKQVAMLRNMILAIVPFCLTLFPFAWYWNLACWFGIALLLSLVIFARMSKEVTLVFEEYEAVKQLKLDENK